MLYAIRGAYKVDIFRIGYYVTCKMKKSTKKEDEIHTLGNSSSVDYLFYEIYSEVSQELKIGNVAITILLVSPLTK